MILTRLIKDIDRIAGPVLLKLIPAVTQKQSAHKIIIKNMLVIRPGGMGDAILLLPVLKHICLKFKIRLDILCEPRNRQVFECTSFVKNIYSYRNPIELLSVLKNEYDAVVDTEQSHFLSALVGRLIQSRCKLGFNTFGRAKLFTHSINYSKGYEADTFWNLFTAVFPIKQNYKFDFPYLKGNSKKNALYHDIVNPVCIFPGATTPERYWPIENWAAVCNRIYALNYTPVLIGGGLEKDQCNDIVLQCKSNPPINLCGQLSISQTVHLFKSTCFLITTDSGILHIGVICKLPTISIFGPSDPNKWGPQGSQDIILSKHCDCSPCARFGEIPKCRHKNVCMLGIKPQDVFSAIERLNQF